MEIQAERCGSAPGVMLAGPGEIDTIFTRAINIRMTGGMCLSVVDSSLDLAPNRIILPKGLVDDLLIQPGDFVRVTGGRLYHNNFTINFSPAEPRGQPVAVPSDQTTSEILKALALGQGACLSFIKQAAGGIIEQEVARLTHLLIWDRRAAWDLIGLGPGFTPAGDDVLVGYCALAKRLGWLNKSWHLNVVEKAFNDSTLLSATALYFSGFGQVQEYLDNVLTSLDKPASLKNACAVLIDKVGTTSGSDMLLGVLAACQHYLHQGRTANV